MDTPSNLAHIWSTCRFQFYIQIVQILTNLEAKIENKSDDEPNILNKIPCFSDWPQWKEIIQANERKLYKQNIIFWEKTRPENCQLF